MFDSEKRAAKAQGYFTEGFNCSQSVAMAFADVADRKPEDMAAIASGFGGGFGRLREVCGCVSGMTLIAGAACPATNPSNKAERTRNYAMVQKLATDFKEHQGSIICRDLIGIRAQNAIESPEPSDRTPQYYHSRGCAGFVACAAAILAANLNCLAAERVPALFRANNVEYRSLDCVNWPAAYPYKPDVRFAIAADNETLYLHYIVREDVTAAASPADMGRIWEDSCVETFIAFDDGGYYNIECSCIGKLIFCFGPGRNDRTPAPQEVFRNVGRWASAGSEVFEEKHVDEWEVALAIPFSAFFNHKVGADDLKTARVNVYKCGDKLSKPHFVSLFPIKTETPDFHRPEFFEITRVTRVSAKTL